MATLNPSAGDPARERALFEAALDLEGRARAAYLEAECGTDLALRRRIEALLHASGEGDAILPGHPSAPGIGSSPSRPAPGMILERPGMTIGRYALLEEIGEGGCGVVYLAEQREPVRRRVALKIIKPGMDTRSVVARFEAERQALALMDHPNIARVLDGGATETGRPFFVMELVRGIRITDFCDERRLSARERLELFIQVCSAIQHAHQKGVIHRDIKPSNILVTVNDDVAVPKVIDFGIAKATGQPLTDKTLVTRFHGLIGTPAYMSPEQAEYSSVDIDTRSDVYSLGVLLYELLVGKPPFDNEEMLKEGLDGVRRTLRDTPPTAPSIRLGTLGDAERTRTAERRRCDVPRLKTELKGDLDWIVLKCLEKDRVRRYESVGALAQDIQRTLRSEPVEARPPTWWYRLERAVHRNRMVFLTGGILATTLVMASVFSTAMAWRERSARHAAEQATLRAESEALAARRAVYSADILAARTALDEGNPGRARALLSAYVPAPGEPDLRGVEWRLLSWASRDESLKNLPHPGFPQRLAMAPDGRRFATACSDGLVRIWDSQTFEKLMEFKSEAAALVYSFDGTLLAAVTGEGAVLRRTDTWEVRRVIPGLGAPMCFATDGQHLFGVEGERWVRWDLEGRERVVLAAPMAGDAPDRATALGKDRIVVSSYGDGKRIAILSGVTGEGAKLLGGMDSVQSVAGSMDGQWVAAGNWHGTVALWDASTGELVGRREALRRGAEALTFSPDSRYVLAGGRDQLIRILELKPQTSEPLREIGTLRGHSHHVVGLRFLPNGERLLSWSMDSTVRVWDMTVRHEDVGPSIPGPGSLIFDCNADATEFHAVEAEGVVLTWGSNPPQLLSRQKFPLVPYAMPLAAGDGSAFIGDRSGGLARWDLNRQTALWELRRGTAPLVPMAYASSSGLLAVGEYGGMGRMHVFRPPAKQPELTLEDFRGRFTEYTRMAAMSSDGRWLAYPGPGYAVQVVELPSGQLHRSLTGLTWQVSALAISSDNQHLAAGASDGSLIVWNLNTGERELGPFPAHGADITRVEFSSDGKTLVTAANAGGLRLWNAANGRSMISIPEAESTPAPFLAEGDRALIFWNLKTGDLERHPAPPLESFGVRRP